MRKINFIQKLVDEATIRLVEPSIDVSKSYQDKSRNTLMAAKILLQQDLKEEATSMAYFSMYNKALSLLYLVGIKCENHAATIILLKELFGIDNAKISSAKKERIDKQYYPNFHISQEEVKSLISDAEEFNAIMDEYVDRLREEEKKKYAYKVKEAYF